MVLNFVGLSYKLGFWPDGRAALDVFVVTMALRTLTLWRVLHLIEGQHRSVNLYIQVVCL